MWHSLSQVRATEDAVMVTIADLKKEAEAHVLYVKDKATKIA